MRRIVFLILGLVYIAFWVGFGIASVGQMPERPLEPFSWALPLQLFLLITPPFALGFMAGVDE